jgi:hypothetical protein
MDADDDFKIHPKKDAAQLGSLASQNNEWYECDEKAGDSQSEEIDDEEDRMQVSSLSPKKKIKSSVIENSSMVIDSMNIESSTYDDITIETNEDDPPFKVHPKKTVEMLGSLARENNEWYEVEEKESNHSDDSENEDDMEN